MRGRAMPPLYRELTFWGYLKAFLGCQKGVSGAATIQGYVHVPGASRMHLTEEILHLTEYIPTLMLGPEFLPLMKAFAGPRALRVLEELERNNAGTERPTTST